MYRLRPSRVIRDTARTNRTFLQLCYCYHSSVTSITLMSLCYLFTTREVVWGQRRAMADWKEIAVCIAKIQRRWGSADVLRWVTSSFTMFTLGGIPNRHVTCRPTKHLLFLLHRSDSGVLYAVLKAKKSVLSSMTCVVFSYRMVSDK